MMRWALMSRAMMSRMALILLLPVMAWGSPATQPASQPTAVPFQLTDTNHILIRAKINGKGPFNFIVDTGAPALIVRVPAAEKIGLKASGGLATIHDLEIEGGVSLHDVQCVVETPFQVEGMNAIGAMGVELDGMMGYGILSRFRMQIDMSKKEMVWTPIGFKPTDIKARRKHSTTEPVEDDPAEATLESTGVLLKVLGPLIKPVDMPAQYRGEIGIDLSERSGIVLVQSVFGDGPADKAGILPGDQLISVNGTSVKSIADAQNAMIKNRSKQSATLVVNRAGAELKVKVICGDEL